MDRAEGFGRGGRGGGLYWEIFPFRGHLFRS